MGRTGIIIQCVYQPLQINRSPPFVCYRDNRNAVGAGNGRQPFPVYPVFRNDQPAIFRYQAGHHRLNGRRTGTRKQDSSPVLRRKAVDRQQ